MRTLWKIPVAVFLCISISTAAVIYDNQQTWTGQKPQAKPVQVSESKRPDMIRIPTPNDAIIWAWQDIQTVDPLSRIYTRYVYIQPDNTDAVKVTSLALNYISRGSVIVRPIPVANGHLLRIDLRHYAAKDQDLADWIKIWEEFAFDPTFALLITKDQIDFAQKAAELFPVQEVIEVPESVQWIKKERTITHKGGLYIYPDDSGRRHTNLPAGRYVVDLRFKKTVPVVKRKVQKQVDVLRFNATHLDQSKLFGLQTTLVTVAPVVEYRYFLSRALSTIQDKGVFKQVFGGLYYQLRGIKKAKDVLGNDTKATDLDLFFENLGIGNIKAGVTQEKLFNELRSDQRIAIFRSDVTGKPREVSLFHTPADREGGSYGAITGDIKDEDVDIGDRAFANLLTPRRQAREAIFPTRNSFNIFALFNGAGQLQDEVPPDIAIDSTIPEPYTRRLQAAIGCLRCHYIEGSDGWKPMTNDVKRLTEGRLDIFGDLSQKRKAFSPDTIDRLSGLYAGNFEKALRRARDDVAEVTLKATGPFKESDIQTDIAKIAGIKLSEAYADYNYTRVNARKALQELGVDVVPEKAVEVFNQLMAVDTIVGDNSIYVEDPRIAAIGREIPVLRPDFALVFHEMEVRLQRNLKRLESRK